MVPTGRAMPFQFTAILVHIRSLLGISDTIDGPRVRTKRRAQAEFLADVIQQRQAADRAEHLLCLGDFNAFGFNDGYVDVLGTIRGQPAPSNEVTLASADLVNPDLLNLIDGLPADERYSFVNEGNAQALDHILVNAPLRPHVVRFAFARCGADFPESFRSNANRPERLSDHDAPIAFLDVEAVLRLTTITRVGLHEIQLEWISEPGHRTSSKRQPRFRIGAKLPASWRVPMEARDIRTPMRHYLNNVFTGCAPREAHLLLSSSNRNFPKAPWPSAIAAY
jgi:hypothetical protein